MNPFDLVYSNLLPQGSWDGILKGSCFSFHNKNGRRRMNLSRLMGLYLQSADYSLVDCERIFQNA